MSIKDKQQQLVEDFSFFDDWQERYEHLISLGKSLKPFPEELKTEDRIVKGCQSQVWIDAKYQDGKLIFNADSDGILPKGIAALLVQVFSGEKVEDIVNADTNFLQEIGFQEFLSPSRANGMLAMIKQIKFYAVVYKTKNEQK